MYGNELLNINQWENVNITDCNPTDISEDFCYPNGDAILKQYGFKSVSTKIIYLNNNKNMLSNTYSSTG